MYVSRAPVGNIGRLVAAVSLWALVAFTATTSLAAQDASSGSLTRLEIDRTERMLERRLACLGCHVIDGRGGRIGPSLDGISSRAERDYVLTMIRDPGAFLPGTTMPHQAIPPGDADRLVSYLMTRTASPDDGQVEPQAPPPIDAEDRANGRALYARHCAACHGNQGAGDGWNAAALPVPPTAHADAPLMSLRPDDTLFDAIYVGGFVLDKSARMPAFGDLLDREQIRALVSYIRVLCDCTQPAWAGGS